VSHIPDLEEDLQATSDALLRDVERLRDLEREKRTLDVQDPRVAELSAQIEQLSRRTHIKSAAEHESVEELQGRTGQDEAP
jgi:hypothetical protein